MSRLDDIRKAITHIRKNVPDLEASDDRAYLLALVDEARGIIGGALDDGDLYDDDDGGIARAWLAKVGKESDGN